jgi:hypothetical protein
MVEMKWTPLLEADPKREYIAFSEIAERKSAWPYFSWLMRARKISKQLKTTKGVIGYTARLEFLSKKAVMVAVFEDEKALYEFAHVGQHSQCMKQLKDTAKFQRTQWSISGSVVPLRVDDAIERIDTDQKEVKE